MLFVVSKREFGFLPKCVVSLVQGRVLSLARHPLAVGHVTVVARSVCSRDFSRYSNTAPTVAVPARLLVHHAGIVADKGEFRKLKPFRSKYPLV